METNTAVPDPPLENQKKRGRCPSLVNLHQSPEERRQKYWLARSCDKNPSWARSMRDWGLPQLERRLGLEVSQPTAPAEDAQD